MSTSEGREHSFTRVLRGGSIYFVPLVLTRAIGFLLLPVYTTYLSRTDYGIIRTAAAGTSLLAAGASLGLIEATGRLFFTEQADRQRLERFLTTTLVTIAAVTTGAAILCVFGLPWVTVALFGEATSGGRALAPYALVALCAIPFTQATEHMLTILQNSRQPGKYALVRAVSVLVTIALVVILVVVLRLEAMGSLIAGLIASVAVAGLAFSLVRTYLGGGLEFGFVRTALRFGLPLVPYNVAGWVISWIDTVFLNHLKTLDVTGLYMLAYTLSTVLQFAIAAVMQAWTPVYFNTLETRGREAHRDVVRTITHLIILFAWGGLALALFSRDILAVMTRPAFHAAYTIVPYLVLYFYIGSLNNQFVNNIYFAGKTKWMSPVTFAAVVIMIPANVLLIPSLGAVGAAIGAIVATTVLTSLNFVIAQRAYPMRFEYGAIAKTTLLAIVLFLLSVPLGGWSVGPRVLGQLVLGVAFLPGLVGLGVLRRADVRRGIQMVRRS